MYIIFQYLIIASNQNLNFSKYKIIIKYPKLKVFLLEI